MFLWLGRSALGRTGAIWIEVSFPAGQISALLALIIRTSTAKNPPQRAPFSLPRPKLACAEEAKRNIFSLPGVILLAALCAFAQQQSPAPEKPKQPPASAAGSPSAAKPAPAAEKKNPVKPTPEVLAEAKKIFGYDCAMCHGAKGDGKGDLVDSMGLKMKDWNDPAALQGMSDGEIYDIIEKGKDKMIGEGNRASPDQIWGLVDYVRSIGKTR